MADSDDIIRHTFVRSHVRRISRQGGAKVSSFSVKCAFCKGKGEIPDDLSASGFRDCPVHGCKAGWLNLGGKREDYKPCGSCEGKGKEWDDLDVHGWKPCHFCHGSGLIKIQ
ncbi:MAG: hypothetical protein HY669_01970 [Chloroflexi bacterium]|nr:hypothetical protein [Chloroflexota bacterium]